MAIVYCTTNKINGKKYIGSTNKSGEKLKKYLGSGINIKQSIKKYGKESFIKQILWEGPSEFKYEMEEYWCKYFNVSNNPIFYNRTNKGFGMVVGFKYTNKQKQLISQNKKKTYYQYSLDGDFIKEWKGTEDIINKLGINAGDISSCCTGKQKTAGGFIWLNTYVKQINIEDFKHKGFKPVLQYDLNGNFIKEYKSTKEAERFINQSKKKSNIQAACANKQKTAYGYVWKYKK